LGEISRARPAVGIPITHTTSSASSLSASSSSVLLSSFLEPSTERGPPLDYALSPFPTNSDLFNPNLVQNNSMSNGGGKMMGSHRALAPKFTGTPSQLGMRPPQGAATRPSTSRSEPRVPVPSQVIASTSGANQRRLLICCDSCHDRSMSKYCPETVIWFREYPTSSESRKSSSPLVYNDEVIVDESVDEWLRSVVDNSERKMSYGSVDQSG